VIIDEEHRFGVRQRAALAERTGGRAGGAAKMAFPCECGSPLRRPESSGPER
jgi:hypothetical protein